MPGQNIGYASPPGTAKASNLVAAWAAEATNYDHEKKASVDPKRRSNHYTQVVWRDSRVCDYDRGPVGLRMTELR